MIYRDFIFSCGDDLLDNYAPYWPYVELCVDSE